jgi:hypothetical protein
MDVGIADSCMISTSLCKKHFILGHSSFTVFNTLLLLVEPAVVVIIFSKVRQQHHRSVSTCTYYIGLVYGQADGIT